MIDCVSCGGTVRGGLSFCTKCGVRIRPSAVTAPAVQAPTAPRVPAPTAIPPPQSPVAPRTAPVRRETPWLTGSLAAAVVVLVIIVFAVAAQDDPDGGAPTSPAAGQATNSWQDSTRPTTVSPTTTTPDVFTNADLARQALEQQVTRDRPAVEAAVGLWIPQLSSKRSGLVVNGVTFGYAEIWADYRTVKKRYPDALLLWSGEFASYDGKNFWVTVVPRSFSAGADANLWCDDQGIGKDDCYAKKLMHTGTSAGTTVLRK